MTTIEMKAILNLLDELAQHVDDQDAEPIFEVKIPCDWRLGNRGILTCLQKAIKERHE